MNKERVSTEASHILDYANGNASDRLSPKQPTMPKELEYLADCSPAMLSNFVLQKLESAANHARAARAEQEAAVRDLAYADLANMVNDYPEALQQLLDRRLKGGCDVLAATRREK